MFVRKFTIDNQASIEFDLLGFSVKDFQMGISLMRCESQGNLYPSPPPPLPINLSLPLYWLFCHHPFGTIVWVIREKHFKLS